MTLVALVLTRAGGLARMALVATCTALVTALLLLCVAVLRLPRRPAEGLFDLVSDPGVRPGTVLALVLLTVPLLLLLHQAVRLGTSSRERRLAGLRIAGATPAEVRRIGGVEVGVPAFVGGLAGYLLYAGLRAVLGGVDPRSRPGADPNSVLHLVPTSVGPAWWHVALVVLGVSLLGVGFGWWGSSRLTVSPVGVSRRRPGSPPRPWSAVLLLVALGLSVAPTLLTSLVPALAIDATSTAAAVAVVALAVLGMTGMATWVAYLTGCAVERRVSSGPALLAARRLVVDPRAGGRAAAAVGGISLVSGGAGVVLVGVTTDGPTDSFFVLSLGLVAAALLLALLGVVGSLAVHSTETLLSDKRSMAALVAQGASTDDLSRSQQWELLLAVLPVAGLGVALGTVALSGAGLATARGSELVVLVNLVLTPALVALAALVATALTRPLVRRAASPENLRTE